jgi:hypothetical protein
MILPRFVDERFLEHRLRSTSLAGIIGGILAILLWGYRFYFGHVLDWYLFAVAMTFITVKMAMMVWYRLTD